MKHPESAMKPIETPVAPEDSAIWAQRQRNNVRLGWVFGALAVVLFMVALWKYRPL